MTTTMTTTTTRTRNTSTRTDARVSGIDPDHGVTPRSISAYRLPRRFDVHQVEQVTADITALAAEAPIDGTEVEMIDLTALAALDDLVDARPELRFVEPSVALRATMAFTGHDRLTARCTASTSFATAA